MADDGAVYLVRVRTDEGKHRFFAVACARRDALDEVLGIVPEGWSATLLLEQMSAQDLAALNLRPGEVREITQ
jgi:hypothetical protein